MLDIETICGSVSTAQTAKSHIRYRPAYEKFRHDKDLDNDQDLVKYFREVINMREMRKLTKMTQWPPGQAVTGGFSFQAPSRE